MGSAAQIIPPPTIQPQPPTTTYPKTETEFSFSFGGNINTEKGENMNYNSSTPDREILHRITHRHTDVCLGIALGTSPEAALAALLAADPDLAPLHPDECEIEPSLVEIYQEMTEDGASYRWYDARDGETSSGAVEDLPSLDHTQVEVTVGHPHLWSYLDTIMAIVMRGGDPAWEISQARQHAAGNRLIAEDLEQTLRVLDLGAWL